MQVTGQNRKDRVFNIDALDPTEREEFMTQIAIVE